MEGDRAREGARHRGKEILAPGSTRLGGCHGQGYDWISGRGCQRLETGAGSFKWKQNVKRRLRNVVSRHLGRRRPALCTLLSSSSIHRLDLKDQSSRCQDDGRRRFILDSDNNSQSNRSN